METQDVAVLTNLQVPAISTAAIFALTTNELVALTTNAFSSEDDTTGCSFNESDCFNYD
jgi:hypothetical protein